jgi:hypothetical protein
VSTKKPAGPKGPAPAKKAAPGGAAESNTSVRKTIRRAGLMVYERLSSDDPFETDPRLHAPTQAERLNRVIERAKQYPNDPVLARKIEWAIKHRFHNKRAEAWMYAVDAIECGLDLLDTGRYLKALQRDAGTQRGRAKGAEHLKTLNKSRGKLPKAEELQAEIRRLEAQGDPAAKDRVAKKYKATPQAIGQKLKKLKDR